MKIKNNKYILLSFLIVVFIIGFSFYQFYKENFSYSKDYYIIKENCYKKKNVQHEYCKVFTKEEYLESYIKNNNPKEKYKQLDTITLTCCIVETTIFSILQFFSPLLIILAIIGTIQSDFSSGMIKNYLLRMEYKKYLTRVKKQIIKISLITPVSLLIIFIVSMLITKFNFTIPTSVDFTNLSVYEPWKYSHFLLYGVGICIAQFFLNILYCNIGLYCCRKNKNKLVAIVMGYIIFLIVDIFIYIIIYVLIINKILGFHNLTDFFNITGYWFFDNGPKFLYIILISFILQFISSIFIYLYYKNKEGVIISSESQNA